MLLFAGLVAGFVTAPAQEPTPSPPPSPTTSTPRAAWTTPPVRAPRVSYHTFASRAAGTRVSFHVYTPAAYDAEPGRRFPVLYWLHGTGGGLGGIAPLAAWFDAGIADGSLPPLLVVFPHGQAASMWCDSADGTVPMETVVVRELLPHVDATFRTVARREGRIVEGFSMGGYGAARFGFKYPDLFGAVSALAGGPLDLDFRGPRTQQNPAERERILRSVFGGDLANYHAQSPLTLAERHAADLRGRLLLRVAMGSRDFTAALNRAFSDHLRRLGLDHTFVEVPGVAHDTLALLRGLGAEHGKFYRTALAGLAAPAAPADASAAPPTPPPAAPLPSDAPAPPPAPPAPPR